MPRDGSVVVSVDELERLEDLDVRVGRMNGRDLREDAGGSDGASGDGGGVIITLVRGAGGERGSGGFRDR